MLTTDPRGVNRSPMVDPDQDSTPELRADDLSRLLTHLDAGPATVFGSSGGAVTALALAQYRPDLVDMVIAHEPPLNEMLADREQRHAEHRGHHRHLPIQRPRRGLAEVPGRRQHRDAGGGVRVRVRG